MKTAFTSIIVGLAATLSSAEPQELTQENCMPFCTEEIENIVFTTESLKSSMQSTIVSLRSELEKLRDESDMKDSQIDKARSERSVWKSKSEALQMQTKDVRAQLQRKEKEIEHYKSFLDEKEQAKIEGIEKKIDDDAEKRKQRYEKKLQLEAEQQELQAARRAKGLDPHGQDDDEDDMKPEPGSKKYFQRIIENLEFTMDSVLKSSHNCQHQLSQCLGKEIHPLLEKAYAIEEGLETELNSFMTSRMNINWCLLKLDASSMLSYVGLGSGVNKCATTNDIKRRGPTRTPQNVELSEQMKAAQAQAQGQQEFGAFGRSF